MSGVHAAPWPLRAVRNEALQGWGVWGEELARRLVVELGVRVLRRFTLLERADNEAVLASASARLMRGGPPVPGPIEAHVRRTVFCEAVARERTRFCERLDAASREVLHELDRAGHREAALSARERSVLRAVCVLDDVAEDDEVGKVVLHAAVAYQMRWNTAHQHVSRAWRKVWSGAVLNGAGREWRACHRLVCRPPSFELWVAARAYLDACSGRGAHAGPAFDAWVDAHEDHNHWFNEWKKRSASAIQEWRALAAKLDASGVRPLDTAVVEVCAGLGLDRSVVPARLSQQSWRELLAAAPRPHAEARRAWQAFLQERPFGVDDAWRALEREAAFADAAGVEVERAYHRLLRAAEQRSVEGVRARDTFRRLVEAV